MANAQQIIAIIIHVEQLEFLYLHISSFSGSTGKEKLLSFSLWRDLTTKSLKRTGIPMAIE